MDQVTRLRRMLATQKLTPEQSERILRRLKEAETPLMPDQLGVLGKDDTKTDAHPISKRPNQSSVPKFIVTDVDVMYPQQSRETDSASVFYTETELVGGVCLYYRRPRGEWLPGNWRELIKTSESIPGGTVWYDPSNARVGWVLNEEQAERLLYKQLSE